MQQQRERERERERERDSERERLAIYKQGDLFLSFFLSFFLSVVLKPHLNHFRVQFLLKTDSGYPKNTGFTVFAMATPGNPLGIPPLGQLYKSPPSPIPGDMHQAWSVCM